MSGRSPNDSRHLLAAFHQGLGEAGFVEAKNVVVEYRWASGQYDRLPALAADLVKRRVMVIAAVGGDVSALAAKQATSTIPIVFGIGATLPRWDWSIASGDRAEMPTGYTLLSSDLEPKRLGLLRDLLPDAGAIAVLLNPNFPPAAGQVVALEKAAQEAQHFQSQQR